VIDVILLEIEWGDPPIQDDPRLFDMNVQQRSDDFVRIAQNRAAVFRTNEVLIPYGCDFQYINAQLMFKVFHFLSFNTIPYFSQIHSSFQKPDQSSVLTTKIFF
jgi:hypothetical protein